MRGAELMRDVALLGARCVVGLPESQFPAADDGWHDHAGARAALRRACRMHLDDADPSHRRLVAELGLSSEAYWLVMLCAATERYPEASAAVSLVAEDARVHVPTPTVTARLLRGVLDIPYAVALEACHADGGAAAKLGIVEPVEIAAGLPRSQTGLRLAAGELSAALADESAWGIAAGLHSVTTPPARSRVFGDGVVALAVRHLDRHHPLVLRGSRRDTSQLAWDIASFLDDPAITVTARAELPKAAAFSTLRGGLVVLDLHAADAWPSTWLGTVDLPPGRFIALVPERFDTSDHAPFDVGRIGTREATRVWEAAVGADLAEDLGQRFRVNTQEADAAVEEALQRWNADQDSDRSPPIEAIAQRLRVRAARTMGSHVSTVTVDDACLDDLIVAPDIREQLDEIIGWYRTRGRVATEMGLNGAAADGHGLPCLFAGASGTGKTFSARCLAGELGLNLYRIDLSQVVSKYIGDTEKALAAVFDEAEAGHGLLLFDEADALFGKRSEVKDAHDRYANIEVGYLLQRLETYDGIAVLTTNLQGNLDVAFTRRLRFVLQFAAPDRDLRWALWDRALPGGSWRAEDLDLDELADRLPLNGGAITNVGLSAAHLAAATDGGTVSMEHVRRAAERELQKLGQPVSRARFTSPALSGRLR